MNLDYLETFCEVVEVGNFSEVARRLSITQPAVSFQIHKLEQDLGVRLIDRGQKGVTMTEAGRRLLRFAQGVIIERQNLRNDLNQLREETVGDLVITASTMPGNFILPSLLSEFKMQHPSVAIEVMISDSGTVIDGVANSAYEVGFCGMAPEHRELEFFKMAEDEIILIVFPGHPFARRRNISPVELADESLIFREGTSGTQRTVESLLSEAGFNLSQCKPTLMLGTMEAVVSAVESGAGIAFVSNLAIKKSQALDLIKVVEIEGLRMKRDFFCIYRKERIVSRLLEEFISFVRLESV